MAGLVIGEGLGLILVAMAVPAGSEGGRERLDVVPITHQLSSAPAQPVRFARTRDERIGAVALRGFPVSESWTPPAKSWESGAGAVIEIGALGSRNSWQPDIAHLSLQWHF